LLIEHGADIDCAIYVCDNEDLRTSLFTTPLHQAAEIGNIDMVKLLLEHGANVNEKDDFGWLPVFYSINSNHYDITQLLLDHMNQHEQTTIMILQHTPSMTSYFCCVIV